MIILCIQGSAGMGNFPFSCVNTALISSNSDSDNSRRETVASLQSHGHGTHPPVTHLGVRPPDALQRRPGRPIQPRLR